MGDEQGYDDQFNDGLFRATLHNTQQRRPDKWPKSVSEMRHHTSYGPQGMPSDHDTAYSDYMDRRPYTAQASFHKPLWHDAANPRHGQVWHGYQPPVDPRAWSWRESGAD